MTNIIQTFANDCKEYSKLDASFSTRCPATYLELKRCPYYKACKDVTEGDWIQVILEELEEYKKEK